jgi:uncharacterized repeat protein (TIGR03803 family)
VPRKSSQTSLFERDPPEPARWRDRERHPGVWNGPQKNAIFRSNRVIWGMWGYTNTSHSRSVATGRLLRGIVMASDDHVIDRARLFRAVATAAFGCALLVAPAHAETAAGFVILHKFLGKSDGEIPEAGLTVDTVQDNGIMYSTTFGELNGGEPGKTCSKGCGNQYDLVGKTLTTAHFFQAGGDGAFPTGEVFVQNGAIYGTTELGGFTACGGLGCGTAFLIAADGTETVLRFCVSQGFPACKNGALPHAGVIVDSDGNAYGTTTLGGTGTGYACDSNFGGCGTAYMLTPNLAETVLYSFCAQAQCQDGAIPFGRLLRDSSGDLYGTTQFGGLYGLGVIFELVPGSKGYSESVLYNFCSQANCADGAIPEAGLIADTEGNLYGTASAGGGGACQGSYPGCGTVFEFTPATSTYGILHSFTGGTDGALPQAPLVMDPTTNNLYGTTNKGGGGQYCVPKSIGCGTVFMLAPDGTETPLHVFGQLPAPRPDGAQPEGALLLKNGRLYGATRVYGNKTCECGTLFKIDLGSIAPTKLLRPHKLRPHADEGDVRPD